MLAGEDLVADLSDQLESLIRQSAPGVVCRGSGALEDGISGDHLARDQVLPDAEVLERALRLRSPELVCGHFDRAEAVGFCTNVFHVALAGGRGMVDDAHPRSAIIFLVSAIARAGLSPFGQLLVQFMIVWQR